MQPKFHSDWGRVIGKIKQNERDCCDTAHLTSQGTKLKEKAMLPCHILVDI